MTFSLLLLLLPLMMPLIIDDAVIDFRSLMFAAIDFACEKMPPLMPLFSTPLRRQLIIIVSLILLYLMPARHALINIIR